MSPGITIEEISHAQKYFMFGIKSMVRLPFHKFCPNRFLGFRPEIETKGKPNKTL
jgi:hypothetical protein